MTTPTDTEIRPIHAAIPDGEVDEIRKRHEFVELWRLNAYSWALDGGTNAEAAHKDRATLLARLTEARAKAIEECAKIADDLSYLVGNDKTEQRDDGWIGCAVLIGKRIRSLFTTAIPDGEVGKAMEAAFAAFRKRANNPAFPPALEDAIAAYTSSLSRTGAARLTALETECTRLTEQLQAAHSAAAFGGGLINGWQERCNSLEAENAALKRDAELWCDTASNAAKVAEARAKAIDRDAFETFVQVAISELPDRNSPEDEPEMMLVSGKELGDILSLAFEHADSLATTSEKRK